MTVGLLAAIARRPRRRLVRLVGGPLDGTTVYAYDHEDEQVRAWKSTVAIETHRYVRRWPDDDFAHDRRLA
jgi:hypothetical protein